MHPLDDFELDGFAMLASVESVVRRRVEDVWRLLALEADEPWVGIGGAAHHVIERFGPGEHRCSTICRLADREICVRGFRRLLAGREVLEVQRFPGMDQLVRISYAPLRFGRTLITSDAGQRCDRQVPFGGDGAATPDGHAWSELLHARHERAERDLAVIG